MVVINCFKPAAGYWLSGSLICAFVDGLECWWLLQIDPAFHSYWRDNILQFGFSRDESFRHVDQQHDSRLLAQGRNGPGRRGLHQGVEMVVKLVPIVLREFRCLDPKPRLMLNLDCVWVSPPWALWCCWIHRRSNCQRHTPVRQVEFPHRSNPDHASSPWLNSPKILMPINCPRENHHGLPFSSADVK